jgi:flagellin-like hook-associated protein FlgL
VAVRIGSNISSLQAQRRLGEATSSVASSLARLSSGQRITRASDDAAGVAIADTLRTRRQVYDRGTKNINDGISLLTIADSALGELAGITTRILELAEQAANGSYSPTQRQALDSESQRLREEFFRISRSTQFNGLNLFDGSVQGLRIQAGFGIDGSVASSLGGKLGDGSFGAGSSVSANPASSFATADFDGDGNIDMVTSAGEFFRGRGNGTFQAATTFATGGPISSVAAGDFNNDGFLDVVTALGTNTLSLYLNNGAGGFQAATSITTGGNASTVMAVDANRDGRMDIVTGNDNGGTDTISVLIGNGSGGFGAATNISVGVGANPVELGQGDFNGDGVTDLALAGGTGLWTFTGNGSGGFGAATSVPGLSSGFTGMGPQLSVADFNGDGLADILAANTIVGSADLFLRSANGATFSAPSQIAIPSMFFGVESLSAADLNGDGALDIVASYTGFGTSIVLGDGRGNFGSETVVSGGYNAIGTTDLNGDGVFDVVGLAVTLSSQLGTTRDGISPILPFSLRTQADAKQAIAPLSRKLEELNKQRGIIGAFQSRLTSAALSATSQSDGFRAAESRIRDVDVAQESSRLSSAQIQQQASTAVLAQANLQPNLALQLLRAP